MKKKTKKTSQQVMDDLRWMATERAAMAIGDATQLVADDEEEMMVSLGAINGLIVIQALTLGEDYILTRRKLLDVLNVISKTLKSAAKDIPPEGISFKNVPHRPARKR